MKFKYEVVLCFLVLAIAGSSTHILAGPTDFPTNWSDFPIFNVYTEGGVAITDDEGSSDPSNGGAAVRPADADIASCSADGAAAGTEPSVLWAYYDGGTPYNPLTPSTMDDDFVLFRLRIGDDPTEGGAGRGFTSSTWDVLFDTDGDGYKEFVLAIDGTADSQGEDTLWVFYNNLDSNAVDDVADVVDTFVAAAGGGVQTYNHVTLTMDSSVTCDGDNQYWFDLQVPLTVFDNLSGVQQVFPDTPLGMFYSTARSNSDPLQKDLMMDPGTATPLDSPMNFGDTLTFGGGATLIDMIFFTADGLKDCTRLNWETTAEFNTAGFHVWRADAWSNGYSRITDAMIPAQGGTTWGAEYQYEDFDVRAGTTYFYKLEDLDYEGHSGLRGPARATVGRADIQLLTPPGKAGVSTTQPPQFTWKSSGASRFRMEFARDPDFTGAVTSLPSQCGIGPGWIPREMYTPAVMAWHAVWSLPPLQSSLYWRVVGLNASGEPIASAPSSIKALGQGGGR